MTEDWWNGWYVGFLLGGVLALVSSCGPAHAYDSCLTWAHDGATCHAIICDNEGPTEYTVTATRLLFESPPSNTLATYDPYDVDRDGEITSSDALAVLQEAIR